MPRNIHRTFSEMKFNIYGLSNQNPRIHSKSLSGDGIRFLRDNDINAITINAAEIMLHMITG
ncbi:MAG: hypothetical protein M0T81_00850, partial [Thermoplasmatales archaeon]|nr:hypothetical protein [Thermoplasmatales archaeon]